MNRFLGITDENFLPGHCFTTSSEGTETSSIAVCYALYELAKNPDVQKKLYNEIKEHLNKNNGHLVADDLQEFQYLEGVLFETIRIHPPLMVMQKMCTKT